MGIFGRHWGFGGSMAYFQCGVFGGHLNNVFLWCFRVSFRMPYDF